AMPRSAHGRHYARGDFPLARAYSWRAPLKQIGSGSLTGARGGLMRRTVSLSEFMPYGAPELLAARRPHLALALTISSACAVLLFAIALRVIPIGRIDLPKIDERFYVLPPPPQ